MYLSERHHWKRKIAQIIVRWSTKKDIISINIQIFLISFDASTHLPFDNRLFPMNFVDIHFCGYQNQKRGKKDGGQDTVPSLKLTQHLKINAWKTMFLLREGLFFKGQKVSFFGRGKRKHLRKITTFRDLFRKLHWAGLP